ncbi:hypothetical protein [Parasphingorhabdus halotolerans]|uniref:Uncharacterized protein n=1 Tax=Parasphingorhabdus halotolerans TaxID=2725558 RepID=A0A6H2DIU7_9SPHN|nr:hypothetical protein [Parasphingorhabdus halotolerans]QJB68067.1 hypothetical protein HF685_01065 [Parasphingorhabdus halotolerans]
MENERVILAIGRIERALSRIEAAKPRETGAQSDPALEKRHATLKDEMEQAIKTIDGLIAREER